MTAELKAPEPVREELAYRQQYFIAMPNHADYHGEVLWNGDETDRMWLARGLIHLTRGAAIAHAKVMLGIDPFAPEVDA